MDNVVMGGVTREPLQAVQLDAPRPAHSLQGLADHVITPSEGSEGLGGKGNTLGNDAVSVHLSSHAQQERTPASAGPFVNVKFGAGGRAYLELRSAGGAVLDTLPRNAQELYQALSEAVKESNEAPQHIQENS